MDKLNQILLDIARAPLSGRALDRIAADVIAASPENSNQRRVREAEERMRWEDEMARTDPGIQAVIDDWRKV